MSKIHSTKKNTNSMDPLLVFCLGEFRVLKAGKVISGFGTNKTRALLAYLVVEAHKPHYRQTLAGMFWADQPQEKAMHNLRQALVLLRKSLDNEGTQPEQSPFLIVERDTVQVNPQSSCWLDVAEFRRSLDTAYKHYQNQQKPGWLNIRSLLKAAELYKGPFLHRIPLDDSDMFLDWLNLEQEALNRTAIEALEHLIRYYERRGDYKSACQYAERIVQLAPWEENGHQQVMRLLAMNGQFRAAEAQYRTCRSYLEEALGVEPSADTLALHREIQTAEKNRKHLAPRFPPDRSRLPLTGSFIGRWDELDQLSRMISDPSIRLITLLGMGGIGKTRLALQAASEQIGVFGDGVYFIPLAGEETRASLLQALADGLSFLYYGREDPETQLTNFLVEKEMLLVFDNFEQLIAEAGFLANVLQAAPRLKILATSRLPLNLRMEFIINVQGLQYPKPTNGKTEGIGGWMEQYDSMHLFNQAAQRISGRPLPEADIPRVAQICQMLDGMPLGIELSAAWIRTSTCAQIASQIETGMEFLQLSMHDVDSRHRSLRTVFEHSWQMLSPDLQQTLANLSVFMSRFTAEAAEAVCGCGSERLHQLTQNSLIQSLEGGTTFAIHKTFNQFCGEKLAVDPSAQQQAYLRQAHYFSLYTAARLPALKSGEQKTALGQLAGEIQNIHLAWSTLLAASDQAAMLGMVEPLYHFFNIRSRFTEGIGMFRLAVEMPGTLPEAASLKAKIQAYLGSLYLRIRDRKAAQAMLEENLAYLRNLPPSPDLAFCLVSLSGLENNRRNFDQSRNSAEEALALYTQMGNIWGQSYTLYVLGLNLNNQAKWDEAQTYLERSIQLSRQSGDNRRLIAPLNLLADTCITKGEIETASQLYDEALAISRDLEDRFNTAILMNNIGSIHHLRKEYQQEQEIYQECLEVCQEIGDLNGVIYALNNLGEVEITSGKLEDARMNLLEGLRIAKKIDDEWLAGLCLLNLGTVHTRLRDYGNAAQYFAASLKQFHQSQSPDMILRLFNEVGSLWLGTGKVEQAIFLLDFVSIHPNCEHHYRQDALQKLEKIGSKGLTEENPPDLTAVVEKVLKDLEEK